MWSRAVMSLASISDNIKFTLGADELTLSAINSTNTCHATVSFHKDFFYEYELTETMSFLINSKHLLILFKSLDQNILYIAFKIKDDSFKLFIEIKTSKDLIKKFQTSYQLVVQNLLDIPRVYKDDATTNFFTIDQTIPKSFLEMVPSSTEDFKIDIKSNKVSFCGYTKQILHDKHYLKQPMAVTISLQVEDLYQNNITLNHSINFRLKEFRNFIHLLSGFDHEQLVTVYFQQPGQPILFEFKLDQVVIQFIQITTNDDVSLDLANQLQLKPDILVKSKPIPTRLVREPSPEEFVTYNETTPKRRKIFEPTDNQMDQSEKLTIFDDQDTEYSSSSQEIDEDLLGPTQANTKPKSILD